MSDTMTGGSALSSPRESTGTIPVKNGRRRSFNDGFGFERLGVPVFEVDDLGRIIGWNTKLGELVDISSKTVLLRPLADLLQLETNQVTQWQRVADRIMQEGDDSVRCRILIKGGRGNLFDLQLNVVSQCDSFGDITSLVCFVEEHSTTLSTTSTTSTTDPSRRSLSIQQKNDSFDSHFALLQFVDSFPLSVDTATVAVCLVNQNGVIVKCNQQMTTLVGYSIAELQQHNFFNLISPIGQEKIRNLIKCMNKAEIRCLDAAELIHRNGGKVHVRIDTALPSNVVGIMALFVSPTDDAVEDCHKVYHMTNEADFALCGLDATGKIEFLNSKCAELFDCSVPSAIVGNHFSKKLIITSHADDLHNVISRSLMGETISCREFAWSTKVGTRCVVMSASPRRDENGTTVGAMLFWQDITKASICCTSTKPKEYGNDLQQFLHSTVTPIFGMDRSGKINEWNEKAAELLGFSTAEAMGSACLELFVSPDQIESARRVFENALIGEGTANFDIELRAKTGEPRYFLMCATPRRDVDGQIVGVIFLAQDVTEAAKHDRAIAAMAGELRQLIDTANAPIFGIDCDGDVNEWNDKIAEITGYTKEEAFDCLLVEHFIDSSMRVSAQYILDSALEGRGTSNFELAFRTKSNERRNLLVNATTRRDSENNVVGVVGVAQDITESVQRDRAVAGMALELRQLIDTANAPIFGIDVDGNVNEWNRRTQEITGYSKEETFDEPLVDRFIAPSMREKVREILASALKGNPTSTYELEFIAKSGESRYLLVNATTRRDPELNVVGVVSVAQDVTEDRKHAAELRRMQYIQATQEAKVETERNMTAYFAHELRNPLGAIDSALAALPDDLPENAKSLISGMQLCCSFMSSIMNNLLDVRKMEEGKMTLNAKPISLNSLVKGVYDMLKPSVKPGVTFDRTCKTHGRDWVLGDEHRIQQVLTNVITNAIKYTVSGSINLIVGWEGDVVKIECVDTGPGIPKREQEKLFQRFVQRGGAPGTGLGLAIAKHLVDLTGGSIRFVSDPTIKAGTSCIIQLPLALCEPPEQQLKEKSSDSNLIQEHLSFLIIDDVKMNRMMFKRRIEKGIAPNCTIREASTGEEALEICGKDKFDVIIVDQYMEEAGGVMVGTDVVYAMRRMRIQSVIIGCSGNDLEEEFTEAGADWVWKKPIPSNAAIIERLRDVLCKRRAS